ncbi:UNVERIFIED_CONTAM: Endoribonuclease Dicer3 [Sesamum radiatum]|uniref:Endoribonuclease Dicer3 n=1 Tax=Sesamum radiatum TaxID=300843 RepID=A0AAW2JSB4_SESRA
MASAEKANSNPLKRSFEALSSSQSEPMDTETSFIPRELLEEAKIFYVRAAYHYVTDCTWQQYKEIKSHTELDVQEYYGARGVDDWSAKIWEKEINDHDVLVMTPQILLDALRKACLSFAVCCFLILDECHRATGNHPYARIMKEFYHISTERPKIFGMTASPVIRKEHKKLLDVVRGGSDALATGQISSKLHELLEIFRSFGKETEILCIIFVERIIAAKVIERLMKKITDLSHFNVSYLTGSNSSVGGLTPKVQTEILESFRLGKVNLLFSTDVVEEGIHVAKCSSVIRFDLPKTVRSYVQSRGRARQKDSQYIIMLERYGIVLKYPEQPLLLLKQSHNSHNLLVDFRNEGASLKHKSKDLREKVVGKPQQHAHMPPELLVSTDIRTDVLKPFYLLPSLMHRMESLMLSSQLREEISSRAGHFEISSSLILEALTTLRCNETFSMERLELLGDSVLKYAEYIRDCAFDPRRWTAPGQRSIWPSPCRHGLDGMEVPLDSKFFSEDTKLMLGKTCDRGHRWMGSKTISDCVEALIGAYYVGGGLTAALSLMKWLGVEAEVELSLIDDAIRVASLYSYAPKAEDIFILESKLGGFDRLRSASVNNDNFAIAAVKRNLHPHLQHGSFSLENQISEFVKHVADMSTTVLTPDTKGPKVLGDLVESIAGAIIIDSRLNLDEVWKVFKPLLSPIVTPDKLELPPSRELMELCDSLGYFIKEQFTADGDIVRGELKLQLEDVLLEAQGSGPNRKAAKGMAALRLLKELELRGITSSKRRKTDTDNVDTESSPRSDDNIHSQPYGEASGSATEKPKPPESQSDLNGDLLKRACSARPHDSKTADIPVLPPIDMKKGGPRNSLYALCKKLQWPMPAFDPMEQKSRTPIQIGDTTGFNSFTSQISLTIPDFGKIELIGEARADKKSSFDSAALVMLYELERRGKIMIGE